MRNADVWAWEMWRKLELNDFDNLIHNINGAYTIEEVKALQRVRAFVFKKKPWQYQPEPIQRGGK